MKGGGREKVGGGREEVRGGGGEVGVWSDERGRREGWGVMKVGE